ncbi:glycosyltransferase family 4 protein [Winogradskyella sp. PE311]|uniref:glycosyltransferase family 4 protein n=1 Tax=Winogradskyella sp. PE311 TaxID=3366943 RepID=UPI0039810ED4
MHICFITNEYPKQGFSHGGIGTFVATFAKNLVEGGHKVSVIGINNYTNQNEEETHCGITVYRLKPRKVKGLTWFFNSKTITNKINEIDANTPIDIVETTELGLAFLSKLKSIKYIIRLHGGHHFFAESEKRGINKWKGFQEKRSFKKSDGFIAVSKYVKSHTAKYLSYYNKPIKIIKNAIDLEIFSPITSIRVKESTLLFAGTVCEKKGITQLIKAMPKVLKHNPDIELYIYGRDWFFKDGRSYIEFLKKDIIPNLNINENRIHFMGTLPLSELAKKYASAECCVFPSLMETQGLVAPEAMAMNKLVIFSECGPGPETIIHNKTGLLCDPYDVNDISDKIIWALSYKEESKTIANSGRAFVLKEFNPKRITKLNIDYYKSVLN